MTAPTVRHFVVPSTVAGRLRWLRYAIARRAVQFGVLLLFFGTAHWGWSLAGAPLLEGNYTAAKLAGVVPLADPYAMLQAFATGHLLAPEAWIGAGVTLVAWTLAGGRAFCAWACPLGLVTDFVAWLRARLGLRDLVHIAPATRYGLLALGLALSALAGVAAFEAVSPIGLWHRALVFGASGGLVAVAGVVLLDLAVLRHGWCGHLCPLGAFWSLAGRAGLVKVRYDTATCTRCGDCVRVCPEPRVLNFPRIAPKGYVDGGACTNCGRCIATCPEASLAFGLRPRPRTGPSPASPFPGAPP